MEWKYKGRDLKLYPSIYWFVYYMGQSAGYMEESGAISACTQHCHSQWPSVVEHQCDQPAEQETQGGGTFLLKTTRDAVARQAVVSSHR